MAFRTNVRSCVDESLAVRAAEQDEARLLIRWALSSLNDTEKWAIASLMTDMSYLEAGRCIGLTKGAMFMARQTAIKRMRVRFRHMGITSVTQVFS